MSLGNLGWEIWFYLQIKHLLIYCMLNCCVKTHKKLLPIYLILRLSNVGIDNTLPVKGTSNSPFSLIDPSSLKSSL
jgi:hypothetical protein